LLPFGAPGDFPPCILHRPFVIAGDWHLLPLRVRAPHRVLRFMGNLLCMGLNTDVSAEISLTVGNLLATELRAEAAKCGLSLVSGRDLLGRLLR
jgi:hypothetical protein